MSDSISTLCERGILKPRVADWFPEGLREQILFPKVERTGAWSGIEGVHYSVPSNEYLRDLIEAISPITGATTNHGAPSGFSDILPEPLGTVCADGYVQQIPFPIWLVMVHEGPALLNRLFTPILFTVPDARPYCALFHEPHVELLINLQAQRYADAGYNERTTFLSPVGARAVDPITHEFLAQVHERGGLYDAILAADAVAKLPGALIERLGVVYPNAVRHVLFTSAARMHPSIFARLVPLLGVELVP